MKIRSVAHEAVRDDLIGCVVATNVRGADGILLRKGDVLTSANIGRLADVAETEWPLHLIQPDAGDVNENEAALRLARAVAGVGVRVGAPVESRVDLVANERGLLKIDARRLAALNCIEGLAVFSLYNDQAVEAGTVVAGAKVTPLLYPERLLTEAESIGRGDTAVVRVMPFLPRPVGAIVRARVGSKQRERFAEVAALKFGWFGAPLLPIETVSEKPRDIAQALHRLADRGAEVMIVVGGSSSDPLDPNFVALAEAGARMERHGAPTHPGTNFWLAYLAHGRHDIPIFGLASCGMFSRTTVGDLFLARTLTGEHLTRTHIAELGLGGLFTRDMRFRFPPYHLPDAED